MKDKEIHDGGQLYKMDLTYHEAHGLLFDREDSKGSEWKTYILAILCFAPAAVLVLIDYSAWVSMPILAIGFGIFMFISLRRTKQIEKIIADKIDEYRI